MNEPRVLLLAWTTRAFFHYGTPFVGCETPRQRAARVAKEMLVFVDAIWRK